MTQTLSKAFGLAGLRLGIAIAHPSIIKLLHTIKPPYNINTLSQQQAIEVLSDIEKVNRQIAALLAERNRVAAYLNELVWVETVFPSDANFLLIRVDDANKRYDALLAQKVVVSASAPE